MGKKNNKQYQTLCIEDIVKKMPMLTESDMNNMCTYEEIVNDALAMFDEKVKKLIQAYDTNKSK